MFITHKPGHGGLLVAPKCSLNTHGQLMSTNGVCVLRTYLNLFRDSLISLGLLFQFRLDDIKHQTDG